jgi:hypothetical protein
MGNLTFNTPLAPGLVTGVSVPTSPASPTNINPTLGAPVENLPTSALANPSFAPPIVTQPSLQPESPVFVAPGLALPTSPAANPAFAGPVEFLPTSPTNIDPTQVGRERDPFVTGGFIDPNSINYGREPVLPKDIEVFPSFGSVPRFDPNDINFGKEPTLPKDIEFYPSPGSVPRFDPNDIGVTIDDILGPQGHIFFSKDNQFGETYFPGPSQELIDLNKSLASQQQLGEEGIIIIGPGGKNDSALNSSSRLSDQYGGNPEDWVKKSSTAYEAADGIHVETHWYENVKTGERVEPKVKIDP